MNINPHRRLNKMSSCPEPNSRGALNQEALNHAAPGQGTSSHGATSHGTPSHAAPGHGAPSHGALDFGAHSNGPLNHGDPSHGPLNHGAPSHGAPNNGAPSHGAYKNSKIAKLSSNRPRSYSESAVTFDYKKLFQTDKTKPTPRGGGGKLLASFLNFFREKREVLKKRGIIKDLNYFGNSLEKIIKNEKDRVPALVSVCCCIIENNKKWLKTEFIYRQSGNLATIQSLRFKVEEGKISKLEKVTNVHDITGLLKLFFRELTDPLIPWKMAQKFSEIYEQNELDLGHVEKQMGKLASSHMPTLERIMRHFVLVLAETKENLMSPEAMATVLGPSLTWPQINPSHLLLANSKIQLSCARCLLDYYYNRLRS